ncbi:endonuclease [Psychromonas sp. psych-6C06]|uniref:endonuclease n=1 Tax=Psychromonas sp. psych-6C06 TaxID=2058089 RepID=UPI001EE6CB13|nr:endonuclease [Psychromonas sp. psych-6C06]
MRYFIFLLLLPLPVIANQGNQTNNSFHKAKKMLEKSVYLADHERKTIYCDADFDEKKQVTFPPGFNTTKYIKRAKKVEWEHVVPAENFGRNFKEWREGDTQCINSKGKSFKGRRCAEKMNQQYRLMQSDMYNLYPAIGAVNAMRSNYNFVMLNDLPASFGSCAMKISSRKVEPPAQSRGMIARSYLYMDQTYALYSMSKQQRQLMHAWNQQFPVTHWECIRGQRINTLQGNINDLLMQSCALAGFR